MALYSVRQGRWIRRGSRYSAKKMPNPYSSDSPDYAERNRETETTLPGGLVRIDIGEPI